MPQKIHPTLRRDANDNKYMRDDTDREYLLNPRLLSDKSSASNRKDDSGKRSSRFKLVTVRRLTNLTLEEVQTALEQQQARTAAAALRSGLATPYPAPIVASEGDLKQIYGVYVDEDLYGRTQPVYLFFSPSATIQCYIAATGTGRDDWMVSCAHALEQRDNPDGTSSTRWRIYHIDNRLPENPARTDYVLDSSALPKGFEANFSLSNLHYSGGGCWSCLAVDPTDRLPVFEQVKAYVAENYIPAGQAHRGLGAGKSKAIVAYSLTPTYSLSWCRGVSALNTRTRRFQQTTDIEAFLSSGVITTTRSHAYSLKLSYRPELSTETQTIAASDRTEFSNGEATYVGSTNYRVNSPYQSPDYGTDAARLSISRYKMETNVIRPRKTDPILPIRAASYNMSHYLAMECGTATGEINHPTELQYAAGSRGYDYKDSYKFWWVYGEVIGVYPIGDTQRYRIVRPSLDRVPIGDMFDLGELKIDKQNRIITTWEGRANPQTGFFGFEEGKLTFIIQYLNPPLIGHDGVYYYELNPLNIGTSGFYDRSFVGNSGAVGGFSNSFISGGSGADAQLQQQQTTQLIYTQLLGALGGGALESINIGFVNIARNDGESVVVREPTQDQKAELEESPHLFPGGFWESNLLDFEFDNNNQGEGISYSTDGTVQRTWVF